MFETEDLEAEIQFKAHLNHVKACHPTAELSRSSNDDDGEDDDGIKDGKPPNADDPGLAVLTSLVMSELDVSRRGLSLVAETEPAPRGAGNTIMTPFCTIFIIQYCKDTFNCLHYISLSR